MAQYLVKGQQIHFTIDDAHVETYDKNGGGQGVKLTGRVIIIKFAGAAPQQNQPAPQQQQRQASQQSRPQQQSRPAQNQQGTNGPDYESFDDDIPFAHLPYLAGA